MSAEILRQAAALMRERAEAAEPGRWKTWGMTVMADPKGTSDVDDGIEVAHGLTPSRSGRRFHTGNAEHIASWHPAVALAVADWLDAQAADVDSFVNGREGWVTDKWTAANNAALAVARAYLGGDQ